MSREGFSLLESLQFIKEFEQKKGNAIVNRGNLYRLKTCIRRAMKGETLRIGFFGGSITQGSLASSEETCYAWLVYKWWVTTFPQAKFEYINGGIGGTSSLYGVARVDRDLLAYQPDFVMVDFSVNDEPTKFFQETYEGLIRRTLKFSANVSVLLLHNVFYDSGKNAQKQHLELGKRYGLPCISIKESLYSMVLQGLCHRRDLTEDDLHPNDQGHKLLSLIIISFLEEVYKEVKEDRETEGKQKLEEPKPLTGNAYENARVLQNKDLEPRLEGFERDLRKKEHRLDLFKNGFMAWKTGVCISFSVECSCLAIQYLKSIRKPVPVAELVIDGDKEHCVLLDGNFEEEWGDCLYLQSVLHHAERKIHTVKITILDSKVEYIQPFYLVAIICS